MSELLEKTGVPVKNPGDGLSSSDINAINETTNEIVDAFNTLTKSTCNINILLRDFERVFTLQEAINYIPSERKKSGLSIKFLASQEKFVEYIFISSDIDPDVVSPESWENLENWKGTFEEIDGGTW